MFFAALAFVPLASVAQAAQSHASTAGGVAVEASKSATHITLTEIGQRVVVDIASSSGIGHATLRRRAAEWPAEIRVRLRLAGLEAFKAGNQTVETQWSVASHSDRRTTVSLRTANGESVIPPESPYWAPVKIAGEYWPESERPEYFEIALPAKLFDENPREITLSWVDFFR